ncbi:AAA domain family protein [Candidatus Phytoplasma oryzae]|uniref:AAA domain family protein n=2 Tax=Candidatus Phytoplasma oryzae TaxID=203274 RepID=A0A139JR67_9MOLU|nr:ATP-binding protein [Candidatus Phytoplasma oryzae]KXT29448.1 AAA domain family protein [Candidatus Phytoplasma oryzae]
MFNDKKILKNNKIYLLVLFFLLFILGIFTWINYKNYIRINTLINEVKDKIKLETELNPITQELFFPNNMQIQKDKNNDEQNIIKEEKYFFKPIDTKKFLNFNELIGFEDEIESLDNFIDFVANRNSEKYQGIGKVEAPLGILFYGVPGTGKTTLVRSLAKEINLPFFEISSSLFSQKYKGIAPQMVRDLFQRAREVAEKKNGAIIFLDECETIFAKLNTLEIGSEIANVVNQFKTEITSFHNNIQKPIFIIGATNHINQIDEAIKSRFTYHIEIKPGNKKEREAFLYFMINKRQNPFSQEAKEYLKVINELLEKLPVQKSFFKTNRSLENILKTTVSVFANNREDKQSKILRKEINKEDLKKAVKKVIDLENISDLLDKIEQQQLNNNI